MFTRRAKPVRIFGDPDDQLPDKWSSAVTLKFERYNLTKFVFTNLQLATKTGAFTDYRT